jgi:hypothetical protein
VNAEHIYQRHSDAMYAVSRGNSLIDVNAARMALWLALDELAQLLPVAVPLPPATLQDGELQLLQINDWLAENAPEHYCQPGNTAETVITVLDAMDNTIALNAAAFGKLAASYDQLAERLHASDTDVADLVERTERMTRKLADLEAALEEANSRPRALNVVAASELPVLVQPNGNGHADEETNRLRFRYGGTDAQLLEQTIAVIRQLTDERQGVAPSQKDFDAVSHEHGLPTAGGIAYRLKVSSWGKVVKMAGREPQKSFAQKKEEAGESRAATFPAA